MLKPMNEIQSAVKRLIKQHHGIRPAGRAVGIDPGYLVRLRDGDKLNPGPDVLQKLGLERRFRPLR